MSESEVAVLVFVAVATSISYFIGHKKGVSNTVDFLENQGYLEFEQE